MCAAICVFAYVYMCLCAVTEMQVRKGDVGVWEAFATDKVHKLFKKEKCRCRWYK